MTTKTLKPEDFYVRASFGSITYEVADWDEDEEPIRELRLTTNGCGCCADARRINRKTAIAHIDGAIAELQKARANFITLFGEDL